MGTSLAYGAMPRPLLAILCSLTLVLAACGGDDDESAATAKESAAGASGGCKAVKAPAARPDGGAKKPRRELDATKRYDLTLDTSCGQIDIRLDQRTSPATAASVASLARSGFYDQHGLPPDRARLRDPGRRPHRHGHRRTGIQHPRYASAEHVLPEGHGGHGQDRSRAARNLRQPVLHRHRRRRRAAARLRRGREGGGAASTWWSGSAVSAIPRAPRESPPRSW